MTLTKRQTDRLIRRKGEREVGKRRNGEKGGTGKRANRETAEREKERNGKRAERQKCK